VRTPGDEAHEILAPAPELEMERTIPGWTTGWTGVPSSASSSSTMPARGGQARTTAQLPQQPSEQFRQQQRQGGGGQQGSAGGQAPAAGGPFNCSRPEAGVGAGGGAAAPKKAPDKCRTLKYFPPPHDDPDPVSVDVIDHGSEVLIVRRDPSPLRGSAQNSVLLGSAGQAALRPAALEHWQAQVEGRAPASVVKSALPKAPAPFPSGLPVAAPAPARVAARSAAEAVVPRQPEFDATL